MEGDSEVDAADELSENVLVEILVFRFGLSDALH